MPRLTACEQYAPENQGARAPKGFAVDKEVKPELKGLMLALCWFIDTRTGLGFPTYRALERATGLHKTTIRRGCRHIAALGYLDIEQLTGIGLAFRLRGGVNRMEFSAEKMAEGGSASATGGVAPALPGGWRQRYPDEEVYEMKMMTTLQKKYGTGPDEAHKIIAGLPDLCEWVAYVDSRPNIDYPTAYLMRMAERGKQCPKRQRRGSEGQLPLTPPTSLDRKRDAALAEPPAGNSWQTQEERERAKLAIAETKATLLKQFALQEA